MKCIFESIVVRFSPLLKKKLQTLIATSTAVEPLSEENTFVDYQVKSQLIFSQNNAGSCVKRQKYMF
jgi:hypothetical protein